MPVAPWTGYHVVLVCSYRSALMQVFKTLLYIIVVIVAAPFIGVIIGDLSNIHSLKPLKNQFVSNYDNPNSSVSVKPAQEQLMTGNGSIPLPINDVDLACRLSVSRFAPQDPVQASLWMSQATKHCIDDEQAAYNRLKIIWYNLPDVDRKYIIRYTKNSANEAKYQIMNEIAAARVTINEQRKPVRVSPFRP